jgi:hypothetical protein
VNTVADNLNNVHCIFQELENMGVILPMGDYQYAYGVIEEARDMASATDCGEMKEQGS